ncbi:hypothetical protein A3K82_02240 [Candidatus Pacearchaeota archaeon RBG_19FT_COMBO_34_9]|nr:MAG: hypothetical protein A3K82_02240 [Candidatus Pacearchaeota archaeon RBG_19FT_COMBO_34_9]OGJ16101.1 MAG: hypothetical protein A3K74_02620 [Candidatus Pacearchaeota archaeon RBG_13_33_26]
MSEEKKEGERTEEAKETSQKKSDITEKIRENPWILSTFVCSALVIILLVSMFAGNFTGNVISSNNAGEKVLDFFTDLGYEGLIISSVKEVSGIYEIGLTYEGETSPIYVTKDGKNIISSLTPIESESSSETETPSEVPKTDKPVVELFVMSYCPYGTQAEKGIIPVAELLGDKIDFKLRFVDYAMHGEKEITENLREYCIQKTAPDKLLEYMRCFLEGDGIVDESYGLIMNGNNVNSCLVKAGIDTVKLNSCISETDKKYSITENMNSGDSYPRFNVDADLNEEYGVQGSPTLIINGIEVSSSRDPASYLNAICKAFTNGKVPEECATQLSSETPSAYFGWDGSGSSTTAQC